MTFALQTGTEAVRSATNIQARKKGMVGEDKYYVSRSPWKLARKFWEVADLNPVTFELEVRAITQACM